MPGLPDLQAQVTAMGQKVTALQASLETQTHRLDVALTSLATAAANGADVPALIGLTTTMATTMNSALSALKAWSDGSVSQTYLQSHMPDPH